MKSIHRLFPIVFLLFACVRPAFALPPSYEDLAAGTFAARARLLQDLEGYVTGLPEDTVAVFIARAEDDGNRELAVQLKAVLYKALIHDGIPQSASALKKFEELVRMPEKSMSLHTRAWALHNLAICHRSYLKNHGPAFEHELAAYEIYSKLSPEEFPCKYEYLMDLANHFYTFRDYNNARALLYEYLATDKEAPGVTNVYNLLGLCFRNTGVFDSAEHYFKKGYIMVRQSGNLAWQGIFSGNLGITYYYQGRYEEAIPLLERDISLCMENKRATINAAKSMAVLADICIEGRDFKKAEELLRTAYGIIKDEGHWDKYDVREIIYGNTARLYKSTGNTGAAYAFMDSAFTVHKTLAEINNALLLAGAQHVIEGRRHLAEVRALKEEKARQELVRNSLLAVLVLGGIIGLLVINRQKILHKRSGERLAAEKRLLDTELRAATEQLNLFTKSIHEKNQLLERFAEELRNAQSASAETDAATLAKLQDSTILTDEEWENFRKLFETVHSGFLWRLKDKLPGLSPAETRFLALSKLKLSNKEMAGMLGISTDAVRMNKHRLRKKLNLPEQETIEELLEKL